MLRIKACVSLLGLILSAACTVPSGDDLSPDAGENEQGEDAQEAAFYELHVQLAEDTETSLQVGAEGCETFPCTLKIPSNEEVSASISTDIHSTLLGWELSDGQSGQGRDFSFSLTSDSTLSLLTQHAGKITRPEDTGIVIPSTFPQFPRGAFSAPDGGYLTVHNEGSVRTIMTKWSSDGNYEWSTESSLSESSEYEHAVFSEGKIITAGFNTVQAHDLASGIRLWTKNFEGTGASTGTTASAQPTQLVVSENRVYLAGGYSGSLDFGGTVLPAGQNSVFLLALSKSSGGVQFARRPTFPKPASVSGLAMRGDNILLASGDFNYEESYLLEFSPLGEELVSNTLALPAGTIATTDNGEIFMATSAYPGTEFGDQNFTHGSSLVAGISADAQIQWVRSVENGGYPSKIILDRDDNIYALHIGTGPFEFDGQSLAGYSVGRDHLVTSYTADGQARWAHSVGCLANAFINSIQWSSDALLELNLGCKELFSEQGNFKAENQNHQVYSIDISR